jgi:phage-related tail fiber protein
MAYLGNSPTSQAFTSLTDTFSGNGSQTAFTLSRNVISPNDILVVVNNVAQQPTNYTVSGNTLTFSPAPSSGTNNIYVRYLSTNLLTVGISQRSVGIAELSASGTPSSATFLRGDNSWQGVVGTPVGTVLYFAANTAPTNYLKANGAAISRSTYSDLFAAIGTTFGAGNGSTTFNIPDMRGYFPRSWDDGAGVDSGRAFGSTQTDAFASHTHSAPLYFYDASQSNLFRASGGANYKGDGITSAAGSGTETRPKNVALLACIRF